MSATRAGRPSVVFLDVGDTLLRAHPSWAAVYRRVLAEHGVEVEEAPLHAALTASQDTAEVEKQFAAEGAVVVKKSPAEFGAFMESEMKKWEQVVKKGNIKAE